MGRYRRPITPALIAALIQEGRGQGHGSSYLPWLTARDVPSNGRVVRILSWTANRIHHLLSGAEEWFFYILDWAVSVKDIREQYPMPLSDTVEIAERLGIDHPHYGKGNNYSVMTIDFLIDFVVDGILHTCARSIKRSKDQLSESRTIEKLEIERTWCAEHNLDWGLATENEIPIIAAENIKIVHKFLTLDSYSLKQKNIERLEEVILPQLSSSLALSELCMWADERLGLPLGSGLVTVKHLIANRKWLIDMNVPFDTGKPLCVINTDSLLQKGRKLA